MVKSYDVIVVGGAPAGLTAAMYATRRRMQTLVLTKDIGGQVILCDSVQNYPGFMKVGGHELMEKFKKQAEKSGAEIIFDEVEQIVQEGKEYIVKTGSREFKAKAVILAPGKTPKSLNVPGEEKLIGRGVSYCATCDGPLYKNKTVAVVGGGNSALDAALYLSSIAKKVYLIHRRDEFRGFESVVEEARKKQNLEFLLSSVVTEIRGNKNVGSILVKNLKTERTDEITLDGIFIEIGYEVKAELFKNLVKIDEYNQIVINNKCETFYPNTDQIRPGIFAAGDVTNTPFKQIVIAAGEGSKAALQTYAYIHDLKGFASLSDWQKK